MRWAGQLNALNLIFSRMKLQLIAYEFEKEIESGERVIVGVNKFADEGISEEDRAAAYR